MERLSNDQQLSLISEILEGICPPSLYSVILVHSSATNYDALLPHVEYEYYRLLTSHTGAEVLSALTEHPVDLLIIAEELDDMKGVELLEQLRKITTELPVIFIAETGSDALAGQVWKLKLHADRPRHHVASLMRNSNDC